LCVCVYVCVCARTHVCACLCRKVSRFLLFNLFSRPRRRSSMLPLFFNKFQREFFWLNITSFLSVACPFVACSSRDAGEPIAFAFRVCCPVCVSFVERQCPIDLRQVELDHANIDKTFLPTIFRSVQRTDFTVLVELVVLVWTNESGPFNNNRTLNCILHQKIARAISW